MIRTFSILSASILFTGCARQSSDIWERVVSAPRKTSVAGNRSAVYADGLHEELDNARVPHKLVTYRYPYYTRLIGPGTAERTSVIYRDDSSADNPWWLMDEVLMRPVWLPTEPVQQQVSFFLRRPATVVTLREYSGMDGKAIVALKPKPDIAVVGEAPAVLPVETPPSQPWRVVRVWRKVVEFFHRNTSALMPIQQEPESRPLLRATGVKLKAFFSTNRVQD